MKNLIGAQVIYFDYLGLERSGRIIHVEPYPCEPDVAYLYIEDEESEFNIHRDMVYGKELVYADIRLSTEVVLDDK